MSYKIQKDHVIINAVANDTRSSVAYTKSVALALGDNNINIKVTAENGQKQDYTLIVNKKEKVEKNNYNIGTYLITFILVGGIGFFIYFTKK